MNPDGKNEQPEDRPSSDDPGDNIITESAENPGGQTEDNNELTGFTVKWTGPDGEEEGPLHVLWKLIESYKVDIFEISLHQITEDFLSFMKSAAELQLTLASSFTVMAARLIYYKSKALLPDPGFEETDSDSRLPPELIQQLLEYRRFQMASEQLQQIDEITSGMLSRPEFLQGDSEEEAVLEVSIVDLIQAYSRILKAHEGEDEHSYDVTGEQYSVEDKMEYIRSLLDSAVSFSFDDLFEDAARMRKGEIVATFLAILELAKLAEIRLKQGEAFGEILITKRSVTVS